MQLLIFSPKLPLLRASWLLLYFCAVPRINHLLRTVPPDLVQGFAGRHDASIQDTFKALFAIPSEESWDANLHSIAYSTWLCQSQLPMRLGGCGLRNSTRTSNAAYWASWADALQGICQRFPAVGNRVLLHLTTLQTAVYPAAAPRCLLQAEYAGTWCESQGWAQRLTWADVAAGMRPPTPDPTTTELGEWRHGWQYYTSNAAEDIWSLLV